MQKAERDRVLNKLSRDERDNFRRFVREIRAEMKAAHQQKVTPAQLLEARGDTLPPGFRDGLEAVLARDQMGPKEGETPPDFNLKRLGLEERVRLSSFAGKRPVAIVFGSYT